MDAWPAPTLDGKPPIVIAHRGASGYLPDNTLEAIGLAIDLGADGLEFDLAFTRDGEIVVLHDRFLSVETDVADHPEFAQRRRANNDPDSEAREDWWVDDFTLAELKTLRARQPREGRPKEHDGLYEIPTFRELIAFVSAKAEAAGRPVSFHVELKYPGYFASIGHDFETPLLAALDGFDAGPVYIQSFGTEILKRLKGKTDAKIVQLVYAASPGAGPNIPLADIAEYADGVGPAKELVLGDDGADTGLVATAHRLGLSVHPWTFRNDGPFAGGERATTGVSGRFRPGERRAVMELGQVFAFGVDGVFADFPDTAIRVRASGD